MQFRATGKSRVGALAAGFAVLLAGCGGSGSGSSSGTSNQAPPVEESGVTEQTVSLSWMAPGQRINGEQLSYTSDIDGYIVLYGQDPENLDRQAVVDCHALNCGYDIRNLTAGTWYFAVQTVDSSGLISTPSQTVSRAI